VRELKPGPTAIPSFLRSQSKASPCSPAFFEAKRRCTSTIMRTFVRLRRLPSSRAELAGKLAALEKKFDAQFKGVCDTRADAPHGEGPASHRLRSVAGNRALTCSDPDF